jgi:hypothetical protein
MLASSHKTTHGVVDHHVAGVVHFVVVDGALDDVLESIRVEIERCAVRALVVETTEPIDAADARHIASVLDQSQWQVGTKADEVLGHRLVSDDGREILLTSV